VALGSREEETVAVRHGPELDPGRGPAVLGFEPGRSEDGLAGDDGTHPGGALGVGSGPGQGAAAEDGTHEVGGGGERPAQLLVEDDALDQGHPGPAVLLGQEDPDEVELSELLPELGRITGGVVLQFPDHRQRAVGGTDPAHGVAEHLLFSIEVEVEHRQLLRLTSVMVTVATGRRSGSRDCRRPRRARRCGRRRSSSRRRPPTR